MVYFSDMGNALMAAIKMQHTFNSYNKENDSQNEIHVRIGIHFGKVIIEEKDIYGDVVNVAAKLTNLANGDQIFVSHEVYELAKDLPSINFELTNFWSMKNVPTGLTIYKVIWEKAPVSESDTVTILHLRPAGVYGPDNSQNRYQEMWDNFIRTKDHLLDNKHESERTLPDRTIILSYKDCLIALDIAERLLQYLSEEAKKIEGDDKPPVYMVIAKDADPKGSRLPINEFMNHPDGFSSGDIYLTKNNEPPCCKQQGIRGKRPVLKEPCFTL